MTSAHIFFIPGMILIGMFLGFIFGARAARNQMDIQAKRDEEREAARAARAARREAAGKTDDRPPAEAKSQGSGHGPEEKVVSEQKDEGKVADEKPAPDDKKADAPAKKSKGKSR